MDAGTLKGIEDWPRIQQRYEAWWQGEIVDRVLIAIRAPKQRLPAEVVPPGQLHDYWTNPERVVARLRRNIEATYYAGDAFPAMHPSYMVAVTAAFLGSPLRFVDTHSSWTDECIHDWSVRPPLAFDSSNQWWLVTKRLLETAAEQAPGHYYVGMPDLNGPGEILARLRGSGPLAVDLIENPLEVMRAMPEVNQAWHRYWQASMGLIHQYIGGYVFWVNLWSEQPATDLQTDFSCMISAPMFDTFFLPFIEEQTRWVERTLYHLDGPGAIRHLESLLCLPRLTAIQWIPGAGAPNAAYWLPLLRRIQARGKGVQVFCEPAEVPMLLEALEPEGLCLVVSAESPEEADRVLADAEHLSARRQWTVPGIPMHY